MSTSRIRESANEFLADGWDEVGIDPRAVLKMCDRIDALAAQNSKLRILGERLRWHLGPVSSRNPAHRDVIAWEEAEAEAPATALARLIAEKQAEVLEKAAGQLPNSHPVATGLRNQADELRRQAEGGAS